MVASALPERPHTSCGVVGLEGDPYDLSPPQRDNMSRVQRYIDCHRPDSASSARSVMVRASFFLVCNQSLVGSSTSSCCWCCPFLAVVAIVVVVVHPTSSSFSLSCCPSVAFIVFVFVVLVLTDLSALSSSGYVCFKCPQAFGCVDNSRAECLRRVSAEDISLSCKKTIRQYIY